jgi:CubicO group peptidase (beta-lactamase class C family)
MTSARGLRIATTVMMAFACTLGSGACGGSSPATPAASPIASLTPVESTADWPASTPAQQGVDPTRLLEVVNRVRRGELGRMASLLVVRHERLLMEEYFGGWSAAAAHTQQSVTKSVTSLAAGLAVDRGELRLDERVIPFFSDYQPIAALDSLKQALTVRDLLMMRTGFDWNEQAYQGSPLDRINNCSCDWIRFMLDWPMREPPGQRWEYVSGGVILLGAVIGRATGVRLDLLLDRELFSALGFQNVGWYRGQPDGLPHTGGGLSLRPRDMAKLGSLVASGGRWQGRQLVSESWIRESTRTLPDTVNGFGGRPATYAYLWWGLPGGVIAAAGAGGQWILVVPDRELVVVSTADSQDALWDSAVRVLYEDVLPATQ